MTPAELLCRFLDLPAELRIQIYEYLVVVGKVFYTPECYEWQEGVQFNGFPAYEKPSLKFLPVCKQIRQEAEDVYFSKNLFVLPSLFTLCRPLPVEPNVFRSLLKPTVRNDKEHLFSAMAFEKVKNLSVAFCSRRDAPLALSYFDWALRAMDGEETFEDLSPAQRMQRAHDSAKDYLEYAWEDQTTELKLFTSPLQQIEIDLPTRSAPWAVVAMFPSISAFWLRSNPNSYGY
jgi:hypothetical protein